MKQEIAFNSTQALIRTDNKLEITDIQKVRDAILNHTTFVFDLDGTLYLGSNIIPGAKEFITKLRDLDKRVFFVTNNSSKSVSDYLARLTKFGFNPDTSEIVISTHATIEWLKQNEFKSPYIVGTQALHNMLRDAGFNQNSNDFDIVVLGFDREFTFEKMTEACQLVHNGLPYIATHPDFYCPTEKGPEPDCGALIEMVRLTTKKDPHWIGGKPSKMMIDVIKQRVGGLEGMIFFGDRLYTDIMMSSTAKISGVLVLSGETTIKDLEDPEAQKLPNFVLDSVRDIL